VLTLGTGFAGLFLYIAGSPTIIFDFLGLDSRYFALQFVPMTAGIIAGSFISVMLSHRLKSKTIVTIALSIMIGTSVLNVLLMLSNEITAVKIILPLALYALGVAMAIPGISVLSIDCFPHNRGTASAVQSFVQVLFSALAASLLVPLLSASPLHFALAQITCVTFAFLFWLAGNKLKTENLKPET
jgi:DHA1 family bicyclomycin/chloramphenicol resistance-like MFS transporter